MADTSVPSVEELSKRKMKELKDQLKKAGLTVSGSKKELAERLHPYLLKEAEDSLLGDLFPEKPATTAVVATKPATSDAPPAKKPKVEAPSQSTTTSAPSTTTKLTAISMNKPTPVVTESNAPSAISPPADTKVTNGTASDTDKLQKRAARFGVSATTDVEMEDRKKKRADRFGLTYTEPKPSSAQGSSTAAASGVQSGDVDRMKKRAERFGEVIASSLKEVPVAPEKLAARAERFNLTKSGDDSTKKDDRAKRFNLPCTTDDSDKLKQRAARFNVVSSN